MRTAKTTASGIALAITVAGCATIPDGPSLPALPGSARTVDQFQVDDAACRRYATDIAGGLTPSEAAAGSAVTSAAIGTGLGAATGALIDGSSGAAAGAGIGLLFGALAGMTPAYGAAYVTQQRYDSGYFQCMYAKGHRVPVPRHYATGRFGYGAPAPDTPAGVGAPYPAPPGTPAPEPPASSAPYPAPGAPFPPFPPPNAPPPPRPPSPTN